ncbi:MAG: hypothetical protein WDZ94_02365 [Patescibacteria group bacterium]
MKKNGAKFSQISQLITSASDKIKSPIRHLIGLEVLQVVVLFVLALIIGINFIASLGFSTSELQNLNTDQEIAAYFMQFLLQPETWVTASIFAIISALLFSIVSAFFSAAVVIRLDRSHVGFPFKQLLKEAMRVTPAVFLAMLVVGALAIGSMALFIIPGLIVSVLLAFTLYEVILEKSSLSLAMRNSYTIVTKHFFELFIRGLALVVGAGLLIFILDTIAKNSGDIRPLFELINSIVGVLLNWFAIAYAIIIYREARVATDLTNTKNPVWMYIVAAIGWIVLIFVGSVAWGMREPFLENFRQMLPAFTQEIMDDPSALNEFENMTSEEQIEYFENLSTEQDNQSDTIDSEQLELLLQEELDTPQTETQQ